MKVDFNQIDAVRFWRDQFFISGESNGQLIADCFSCGKERHWYASKETGAWDCKKCGISGNIYTYLREHHKLSINEIRNMLDRYRLKERSIPVQQETFKPFDPSWIKEMVENLPYKALVVFSRDRGIRVATLEEAKLGMDSNRQYTLPVYDERGQIVNVFRKRLGQETKNMAGGQSRIYGIDDAIKNDAVYCVEGPWSKLALNDRGYPAVGFAGAGIIKQEDMLFFKDKTVYLIPDTDESGLNGMKKIAEKLKGIVRRAFIIHLPKELGEKKDVRDYFKEKHTKEEFEMLPKEEIKISSLEVSMELFLKYQSNETGLTYEVDHAFEGKEGTKARFKILQGDKLVHSDTGNLSNHKTRLTIGNRASSSCSKKGDAIAQDLMGLEIAVNKALSERHTPTAKDPLSEVSEEEKKQAIEFLKRGDLLAEIQADIRRAGLVGEEDNGLMVYLCCSSRVLENPISLILKGRSSSGKSFTVRKVLALMPEGSYKEFAYMTPKSIAHMKGTDLKHKILFIAERPGAEASDYSIRILQSEGKIRMATVVKDEASGRHETVEKEIEGPVAYIETTTKSQIHAENETRLFSLFSDESEDQTKLIHEQQKDKYRINASVTGEEKDAILRKHKVAQMLLHKKKVVIPFVDHIVIPASKVRSRRDNERFLSMIEISTVLHQYQRETVKRGNEECLVATVQDYAVAYRLAYKTLMEGLGEVSLKARKLYNIFQEHGGRFSRNDMCDKSGWNLEEVKKYAGELVRQGYFYSVEGGIGKKFHYKIGRPLGEPERKLLTPQDLVEKVSSSEPKRLRIKRRTT